MPAELAKAYESKQVESRWYQAWEAGGLFHAPEHLGGKKPYCIVIPPPNVTGALHMGHALNNTLQDILIRWKRMQGFAALWHAGHGPRRHRDAERGRARDPQERRQAAPRHRPRGPHRSDLEMEARSTATGSWISCARWAHRATGSATRFTLDDGLSQGGARVLRAALRRGADLPRQVHRQLVPALPHRARGRRGRSRRREGHTSGTSGIRWPTASGNVVVATTRPETMLGDTAVAVNPKDERYTHLVGKMVRLPGDHPPDPDHRRRLRGRLLWHRVRQGHPGARPERLPDRRAAQPPAHQRDERRRHDERRGGCGVRGAQKPRLPREAGGGLERRRAPGEGRGAPARGGALLPLPRHDRAVALGPVVRADAPAGRGRDPRHRGGQGRLSPGALDAVLPAVAGERARLVHLPADLVGAPDSRLVLPRCVRQSDSPSVR